MDEIKRKLAAIDAQLAGHSLHTQLIATTPLLFAAMGLMVGIAVQSTISSLDIWTWVILLLVSVAAMGAYVLAARHKPDPRLLAYVTELCFLCLGAIRLIAFTTSPPSDIRRLVGTDRILATLRGHILTSPYQERRDWCFAQFSFSDPSTTFYLGVEQAQSTEGWARASGTIRVHVDEPTLNLNAGDRIEFHCWLHRFDPPTNPGQFNVAAYLARRNVYVGASVPSRDAITPLRAHRDSIVARWRGRLSEAATQALLGGAPAGTPTEGLLQALLLGNRRDIDRDTYEAFRRTGLLHFVSLSGLHLGIFVWVIWGISRIAGLAKPYRALACIIATATFLLVVPPRAPTVRAAVIVWVYCLALLLRRRTNPLNSLCLAAIVLLLIRPTQLFEAGWQLSFAAVAGILALTARIEDVLHSATCGRLRQQDYHAPLRQRLIGHISSPAVTLFATGIAAWVGGAGILLYHFFTITPLTAVWTVLVFPLVGVILVAGLVKIALFALLPTASALLGAFVSWCAALLIGVVKLLACLEVNTILIGHVALWLPVAYYGLVLFASFARTRHVVLKRRLCLVWALALIGCVGMLKWQRTHRDHLRLTVLDVGHGQAILARLPGTRNVLFDAGSLYTPDVGARIVVPCLDYMGIGRLQAILISHSDVDHVNGIPEIVAARRVDRIYAPDAFFLRAQGEPTAQLLIECLARRDRRIEPAPEEMHADAAAISTLWPIDGLPCPDDLSDNDRSLVSLIEFACSRLLLCSDIEQFAQKQIMATYPQLRADIVVCPHHGSLNTLEPRFIESFEPDIVVCSGSRNDYDRHQGKPPTGPARQFHTGQNGAIEVCVETSNGVEGMVSVHVYQGEEPDAK